MTGSSYATWSSPLRAHSGGWDAFVAKLSPNGALLWNSFLGGSGDDHGYGLALDASGNVYVTGYSTGTWGSPLRAHIGNDYDDIFVAKLSDFFALTVGKSGSGTVTSSPTGINCGADCSENYSSGTLVTLTASPASGWQFSGWSGDCSGNGGCSVTMNTNRNVTATFTAIPVTYTLTVGKNGSGTLTSSPAGINCGADCSENYSSGTLVTLTASPASGWQFSGWSGDCSGNGGCSVTMNTAKNVVANFALSQSISDALDNINLIWTTGGGASWLTQLIESVLGGKAVQSGVISDNQTSYLRTSAEGPGWVRFWWKVSSEEGYDFLRFYIDDQLQVGISGEQDWIQETFSLTSGLHTLVWAYDISQKLRDSQPCQAESYGVGLR